MSVPLIAEGYRVVEVSDYVFVPVAGAVLASLGADVIKVEHHERGDAMRGVQIQRRLDAPPGTPEGPGLLPANLGKRSIGINLGTAEGREVLYALVREADVFLTNRTTPVAKKLGIDLESIRAQNPRIVYAHGTAHGTRGPEGDRGGFDTSDFWYRGGVAAATHVPDAELPPGLPAPGFGDLTSGHHLVAGVLGALLHRERTGEALTVEVSLLGSALWSMGYGIASSTASGRLLEQNPRGRATNPLHDVYRTRDGKFVNMCSLQGMKYFAEFCTILGLNDLAVDERFATEAGFVANAAEATRIFAERIATISFHDFMAMMHGYSGQWAPIQDTLDLASDVQVVANDYLTDLTVPSGNTMKVARPPVQFNGAVGDILPAPGFNEHGDAILTELGMTETEILDLKIAGAVT